MTVIVAAAAAEPQYGWGKLVALLVAVGVFWLGTIVHTRLKQLKINPSPSELKTAVIAVKAQVTAESDSGDSGKAVAVRKEAQTLDEFVAQRLDRVASTAIVRDAKRVFKVSQATAWRAIRKARDAKDHEAATQ